MTTVLLLIQQVLIMFLLTFVGYICFRTKKISLEGSRNLGNILIYLSLPCVIIKSFLVECTAERLMGLLFSSITAISLLLISIMISRCFFSKNPILCFASSFSNPGFFALPLIIATISEGAVFYVATFIAFLNMLQWTYGVVLMTQKKKTSWKNYIPSAKRLFTAPFMIAILIGLFFFLTGISMPKILLQSIQHIAGLNTPLAMFSIGIYLAQTNIKEMLKKKELYLLSLVRLIIIPILSLFLMYLIPENYSELKMALLIASACPVGSNVAVYAQLYDNDYSYAVETVVISTLISVISIPIVVHLAEIIHFI